MADQATEQLFTEKQVSYRLQIALSTLRHWRTTNKGPVAIKLGNRVRYPGKELDKWIEAQPRLGSTA
jgi:predicted DNA-binding transcriptional regulator AlpA